MPYLVLALLDNDGDLSSQVGTLLTDPWTVTSQVTLLDAMRLVHDRLLKSIEEEVKVAYLKDPQMRGPRSGGYRRINEDAPRVYGDMYYADIWASWGLIDHRKAYTVQLYADALGLDMDCTETAGAVAHIVKLSHLPIYVQEDFEQLFYDNKGPLTIGDIPALYVLRLNHPGNGFAKVYDEYVKTKA